MRHFLQHLYFCCVRQVAFLSLSDFSKGLRSLIVFCVLMCSLHRCDGSADVRRANIPWLDCRISGKRWWGSP